MKNNFLTGLAILLPIALTFWILNLIVNLLTAPFIGLMEGIFNYYHVAHEHFWIHFLSKLLVLVTLVALVFLAGLFARLLFLVPLFKLGDQLLHKVPLFNKVYKAAQDVVHSLFSEEKTSFSQVVLVPFPNSKGLSIGLISSKNHPTKHKVSVFVPGTPNPTMGFMLLFREDQIIPLDLKVDEALKFVVSCGVITPKKGEG